MPFSSGQLVRRSAWFYRSVGLAVALGVASATAVVCGALLVGDSMRGSLRGLTLERLGEIDAAVMPSAFFDTGKISEALPEDVQTVPIIHFVRGVVEAKGPLAEDFLETAPDSGEPPTRRSGNVQIVAVTPEFWSLGSTDLRPRQGSLAIADGEEGVVLNQRTATELQVIVGDEITVRLPSAQAVPADSPLGRRDSQSEGIPRLKVLDILPNEGLGRFALMPSQSTPLIAYLPLTTVQEVLDRPGQANTLLLAASGDVDEETAENLTDQLQVGLGDFGLQLNRVRQTFGENPEQVIFDYYNLTSERLLLADPITSAVRSQLGLQKAVPVLTYLANNIETADGSKSVPYSTLSAIDSTPDFPLQYGTDGATEVPPGSTPMVLNSWAAEQLDASVGDTLNVAYFEPETSSGKEVERTFQATVTGIVPITQPSRPARRQRPPEYDAPPTIYNDPDLTPTVPGVTDQDSINDWDLPFELERNISQDDDDYWTNYRLTPKAFIPLEAGRRLFGSRFGDTSSLRIETSVAASLDELNDQLTSALRPQQASLGFAVIPIKLQQLNASQGTTPFDALFLSLSMFVIVAALMLVALLFRLGLEQRASEYGALMAIGIPGRSVSRMALAEGTLVAIPGAVLGVLAGVLYAFGVLWALSNWWVGAVTVPFLQFHWTWTSILAGFFGGILMASFTILITTRRLRRAEVRPLLSGSIPESNPTGAPRWLRYRAFLNVGASVLLLTAILLGLMAIGLSGPAQAGAFVGGGMLLLCAMLLFAYSRLTAWQVTEKRSKAHQGYRLATLALRSVGRNPVRSTLSIGLMAVACFLIISMSAFQMRPSVKGVGGFDLIGQSAVPLFKDVSDPAVRETLINDPNGMLNGAQMFGLRFRPGQDASCNNLYQASQPRVLGIPESLTAWYSSADGSAPTDTPSRTIPVPFDWASIGAPADKDAALKTPWNLLEHAAKGTADDPVPMILDQNTALWSLQMRGGVGEVRSFTFDDGIERHFKVVALLQNSVLQGSLMVSESNFETSFPEINGYSYFLAQLPPAQVKGDAQTEEDPDADFRRAIALIESQLGDIGMDMVRSREVLAGLMAVQNTYLKTFQSLGALGLLLGTFGLAVVQLRNVLERRGELALLRAVGFSTRRLLATVMIENITLLVSGIACGTFAALAAVIPYMTAAGTQPAIGEPLLMLGIVLVVGVLASTLAMRKVARMPLLENL